MLKRLGAGFGLAVTLFSGLPALAATVVTNEPELDAIFAQDGFTQAIDIRFLDPIVIDDPRFLDVDSVDVNFDVDFNDDGIADFNTTSHEMDYLLFGMIPELTETDRIYMMYVDTISVCGSTVNTRIVGCAAVPGTRQAIESSFAEGRYGAELMAHEMVHNLGVLPHRDAGDPGLMSAALNGNTTLNAQEIAMIEASELVLDAAGPDGPFIQVQPVLFVDAGVETVPLPPGGLALAGALGVMGLRRRLRS